VGKRFCELTVQAPDGKRHTITVEAESVYDAAIQFVGRAGAMFSGDPKLPKTD
jgi:VCBS repeat-containing protein